MRGNGILSGVGRLKPARRLLLASSSLVALATSVSPGHAQSFQGLGFIGSGPALTSTAGGISADGSIVVGTAANAVSNQAFRWSAATGMVGLGAGPGGAFGSSAAGGVSADGSVLSASIFGSTQAARWTAATGFQSLEPMRTFSQSSAISADGNVIVGFTTGLPGATSGEAFRWTAATGVVGLGFLPGNAGSRALGIDADGGVIVGDSSPLGAGDGLGIRAFRWTQPSGMISLGVLPGDSGSSARAVTADGSTIFGSSSRSNGSGFLVSGQAFRWTQATGMVGLGVLPGDNFSSAFAVSADGAVMVGNSERIVNGTDAHPQHGILWDQVFGMQDLRQVLTTQYGINVTGWELTVPLSVSADGSAIAGFGIDPTGHTQAFLISGLLVNRLVNGTYVVAPGAHQAIGILGGSGTVQIGAGASLSVAGNNLSSDPVNFPNSVFSGTVTGAGDLIKAGSGLWQFNGSFQSQGNVLINSGTFALGGAGSVAGAHGVVANGTLDISGISAAGASIQTLSGSGNVALGARTLMLTNASGNFAGVASGTGGLTLAGGMETLSGLNNYTGPTTVSGGVLSVTGSIASSNLTTVNAGGILAGTGTVGNIAITDGGTFAPGNGTPGSSMTVSGNLAFQSGALYLVTLNPTTASFASVGGTASLNGSAAAVYLAGNYILKKYTILTAAGGVGGTFGSLVNTNVPASFTSSLSYDANNAYIDLALNLAPNFGGGLNVNQQNVANALTNFFNATGGIPAVFGTLTPAGLTQASGELATASQQTTFDAMNLFLGLLTDPFVAGRGAGVTAGATSSQLAEESDASAYAAGGKPRSKDERDAYAAVYRKASIRDTFDPRWSVWSAAYGGSQTTDGNAALGSNNTRSGIGGVAVGADYLFSPRTIAGFAVAGGGTGFSVNGQGTGRSDLFQAGAFVRHTAGPAYVSAAVAYGWQNVTTDRTVTIAGTDLLHANFNANTWSGRVEGGYRFVAPWMGGVGITPYAAGQFTTIDLPAYAEQAIAGANTFALAYGAKNVTDSRSELGIRTDKSYPMQNGIFTLRGRAAWAHDFNPDRNIGATFQTLPGASFVVNGAAQASDSALVTGSAEMKWLNGFSLAGTFEGAFSSVTSSYAGKGVARYTW
jgi:probable HAF family extracellular repeat protein